MANYVVREDVENIFGEVNVERWADLNNDKQPIKIQNRINYYLAFATAYVNSRLIQGRYEVPFDADGIPTIITHLTALYAGVGLYGARRTASTDRRTDEVSDQRKEAKRLLREILSGQLRLIHPLSGELLQQQSEIAPTILDESEFESTEREEFDFSVFV